MGDAHTIGSRRTLGRAIRPGHLAVAAAVLVALVAGRLLDNARLLRFAGRLCGHLGKGWCVSVHEGQFHVWTAGTIDEGIEHLTGVPAGRRGPDGGYPAESVHGRVDRRLAAFADRLQSFGRALA